MLTSLQQLLKVASDSTMGNDNSSTNRYSGYLSKPILYPLIGVFFLFGSFFIGLFSWNLSKSIDYEASHQLHDLKGIFQSDIQSDVSHMTVLMDEIQRIPGLKEAFEKKDRETLFELTVDFYKRVNQHLNITHFYFSTPDRINLLRVHNLSRFGDRIDRYTTIMAEKSGKLSYGLELGVLGTFTLRMVVPWYDNETLIGFIEIGEEIDHITQRLRELLNVDIHVFINKKNLIQENWSAGMTMLKRDGDWARFPEHVYIPHNIKEQTSFAKEITRQLNKPATLIEGNILDINIPQKHIKAAFIPLYDVQKNKVGKLLISIDVTQWRNNLYLSLFISIAIAVVANLLLIFLFMRLSRKTENELNRVHQQFMNEADARGHLQEMHIEELEAQNRALELSQNRLGESEEQLQKAQHLAHLGSWEWDFKQDLLTCSSETRAILGITHQRDSCQIEEMNQAIHKDDRERIRQGLSDAINGGKPFDQEYRIVRPDGSVRLVHGHADLTHQNDSDDLRLIGTMQDLTELKHTEEINRHLGSVLDSASNEIILFTADSKTILQANLTAQQHLNYSEEELYSMHFFDILLEVDETKFNQKIASLESHQSHEIHMEAQFSPKKAPPYHVELRIQKSQYNSKPVYIALALDTSEKHAQQRALVHQGLHDPLTELPNRLQLTRQTQETIKSAQLSDDSVSLVLININRFQEINDTLGHHSGDQILLQYAKRIESIMPEYGTLFHIGGDNFAILLNKIDSGKINTFIHRIESALQRPFSAESYNLIIDSSFGVAAYPEHAHNEIQLLQFAEIALKRSKEYLSGFEIYDPNLDPFSVKRLMITSHMRHAIEHQEFSLHFQPKVVGKMPLYTVPRYSSAGTTLSMVLSPLRSSSHLPRRPAIFERSLIGCSMKHCSRWLNGKK